jgi:hypothetical protein
MFHLLKVLYLAHCSQGKAFRFFHHVEFLECVHLRLPGHRIPIFCFVDLPADMLLKKAFYLPECAFTNFFDVLEVTELHLRFLRV